MTNIPTPHIAAKKSEIAKTVLMPGDPLRAKFIAETWLEDPKCFNTTRNMFGYTGKYKGKKISVMGSGMGIPSSAIYVNELYRFYDVESIIRIGSAGALQDDIQLNDLIIAMGASTDSGFARQFNLPGTFAPVADYELLEKAVETAKKQKKNFVVGNILSSDIFYNDDPGANDAWKKMGVLAVEMEAAGLYMTAARLKKKALCILTVSDHIYRDEKLSAEERQTGFADMIEIALELS